MSVKDESCVRTSQTLPWEKAGHEGNDGHSPLLLTLPWGIQRCVPALVQGDQETVGHDGCQLVDSLEEERITHAEH